MALLDQPPPNRLRIVEKGGRLVVIDRLTGTTPPTAVERMKAWDAQSASQSPQHTKAALSASAEPAPPRDARLNHARPAASSLWAEAQRKTSSQRNRSAALSAADPALANRQDMLAALPKASKDGAPKRIKSLPFALLILFILIAAWDVLNGFVIGIMIFVGAAALLNGIGSLTSILSQPLKNDKK